MQYKTVKFDVFFFMLFFGFFGKNKIIFAMSDTPLFGSFEFRSFGIVSNFGIRASNLNFIKQNH